MALKKIVKESIPGFIPFFRRFKFSIRTFFLPRLRNINTSQSPDNLKLGSDEHGWTLLDKDYLHGSTILSVGLGEDASFDIEFCNRFASKVIIVDPTPGLQDTSLKSQCILGRREVRITWLAESS